MPIHLNWYNTKQNILIYTFEGNWTWEEFRRLDNPTWELINKTGHRIDLLLDFTLIRQIPLGITDIMQFAGDEREPDTDGHLMVIGGPAFIRILGKTFRRLYPKMGNIYHYVDTLEEAHTILESLHGEPIKQDLISFR